MVIHSNIWETAFSRLNNLKWLTITNTLVHFIPENAFDFNEESEQQLTIRLYGNKYLNNSGFSENSLTRLKRPTTINLDSGYKPSFVYLDQRIFEPFLLSNAKNIIKLYELSLDCNDCKNYWLQQHPNLHGQVLNSRCSNGNPLDDPTNFIGCKDGAFNFGQNGTTVVIS